MKSKKVLSTVVASALVATTMAMPVMAADGGSVDVDVSTKNGVLRVQVPTKMAMEIDQFEITQAGSQIACPDAFDMTNYSEMAVKVNVTSTATVATGNSLVSTKEAATESTGNEAWLAVAAKTGATSYDDLTTGTTESPVAENYWDLSEANANVTTFATADGVSKAEQTFYLSKATGNTEYKLMLTKNNKTEISYAQFYELTAIATQPNDDDALQAAVDASDVYVITTANVGNDGESVTKIAKGEEVAAGTCDNTTKTYYTAAANPSPVTGTGAIADGKLYVYAAKDTDGGKAGFRYVGKLSDAKDTWTNEDISAININYTITGVTASNYEEISTDTTKGTLTYGYYKEGPAVVEPQISVTSSGFITITGMTPGKLYKSMNIDHDGGNTEMGAGMEWNVDNYSAEEGGDVTIQLSDAWMTWLAGQDVTVNLVLTDDSIISASTTLDE